MKKAVTIKEIAEQLHMSRNTVSKALNGQYVPEKTRQLVLDKARQLNYKCLNNSWRAQSTRHFRFILLAGKPLNNMPYYVPLIKSIENLCFENNCDLFQYVYNKSRTPFKGVSDYISELNVDGIIAIECFDRDFISRLLGLDKPICFIDFAHLKGNIGGNFDIICANDRQSVEGAVAQIIKKYGLSRFTFVGDNLHCMSFRERYLGMIDALFRYNVRHSKAEDILANDDTFNYGDVNAIKTKILQLRYRSECFVCCNDFVARVVCNALKELGIRIPEETLVLGFDNVREAHYPNPTITTFSVDKEFIGKEALRALVNRIETPDIPTRIIHISTVSVAGKTTLR